MNKLTIPTHMEIAFSQIGVKEWEGDPTNPEVNKYLKAVDLPGDDKIPWCAAFVGWTLNQALFESTQSGLARSYLNWGEEISQPEFGSIVVLRRGMDPTKGHVGFYLDEYPGFVVLLGGNQMDKVGINFYSKLRVLSYRRVDYGA